MLVITGHRTGVARADARRTHGFRPVRSGHPTGAMGAHETGPCQCDPPCRLSHPWKGSGTVVGIMLMLLAAALLGALMTGSSLVIRRAEARQEADLAALSAASARAGLLPGSPPCGRAASVLAAARSRGSAPGTARAARDTDDPAVSGGPRLVSCRLDGQDAVVTVRVGSGPLSALTQTSARAGPADCTGGETDEK